MICPICSSQVQSLFKDQLRTAEWHLKNEHPRHWARFQLAKATANQHKQALVRLDSECRTQYGVSLIKRRRVPKRGPGPEDFFLDLIE